MAHKRKGQLTVSGEWAQHLRPSQRRAFWKGERQAGRDLVRAEAASASVEPGAPGPLSLIAVLTTLGTHEQARALAAALVESGLVACAQITPIESYYRWHGALQHDTEFRLLLKTTRARYADVEAAIRAQHPYELPAIFAIDVGCAFGPYADWVAQGTKP